MIDCAKDGIEIDYSEYDHLKWKSVLTEYEDGNEKLENRLCENGCIRSFFVRNY